MCKSTICGEAFKVLAVKPTSNWVHGGSIPRRLVKQTWSKVETKQAMTKPMWPVEPYASHRARFFWLNAPIAPVATDKMDELRKTTYSTGRWKLQITPRIWNRAILGTMAMKAVTTKGAPSYKSGAHMWKGEAAILMRSATTIRIQRLLAKIGVPGACNSSHNDKLVVPVSPYRSDVPNSSRLLASPLISKYLMAASVAPLADRFMTHKV